MYVAGGYVEERSYWRKGSFYTLKKEMVVKTA